MAHACCTGAEGNTYLVQDVNKDQQLAIKLIKLPLPTRFVQAIFRCRRVYQRHGLHRCHSTSCVYQVATGCFMCLPHP